MSSTTQADRLQTLLNRADEAIAAQQFQQAADALREASHLDAENASVKQRWATLQKLSEGDSALDLLRSYLSGRDAAVGVRALQALKQRQLSPRDAEEATTLLLAASDAELLDQLTGVVLGRNALARKSLAVRLSGNATEVFELLFARGQESFNALASIPLEKDLWSSSDDQATAQRDLFLLSIAKMIDAGAEHLERVLKCIARLLSFVPDVIEPLVDADAMDAILSSLDLRVEASTRSQAMLATSKIMEATKEKGEELFSHFITTRAGRQTNDDLIVAFSAAAAVFPVIPAVAARLFLIDGFVQQLVPNLDRNWDDGVSGKRKSHTLETAALELLSAACVDKSCREAINRYCAHWLENLTEERQGSHKALAALVLAKINAESSVEVTGKLEQLVLSGDAEIYEAIEGLAYTTLQPKMKENVAGNKSLLTKMVSSLKGRPAGAFGCLTVLSNLTMYKPSMTAEQKKMSQLKAYANSQKPTPDDPLDDDKHVTARCSKVLDAETVPAIVAVCKQTTSPTNVTLVVSILLSLAREQKHRAKMTQQGAVRLLMQIRDRLAKSDKPSPEASQIERNAAHALARLLISVNPEHVFSSSLPASSAVSALVTLLSIDRDSEQRTLLPTFESLLALTNLASMQDDSVRELQLRLLWTELEDNLLLSPNNLVQRASVELICNLMASPQCVAKFVGDGSKRESTRMQILLALADVEDMPTRRAAGGALAMLTEWDAAVTSILAQPEKKGIKSLLTMCGDESEEVKHRGFACLANVLNAPSGTGEKGLQMVKEMDGVQSLQEALKSTKSRDVMAVGVEVLKKLM